MVESKASNWDNYTVRLHMNNEAGSWSGNRYGYPDIFISSDLINRKEPRLEDTSGAFLSKNQEETIGTEEESTFIQRAYS